MFLRLEILFSLRSAMTGSSVSKTVPSLHIAASVTVLRSAYMFWFDFYISSLLSDDFHLYLLIKIVTIFFPSQWISYIIHCVKCVRIQSFSGRYFPAFGIHFKIQLIH